MKWGKEKQNLYARNAGMNRQSGWGSVPDADNGTRWWKKQRPQEREEEGHLWGLGLLHLP